MIKFSKSERINKALNNMSIHSFYDVIYHLPRRYDDLTPTRERYLENKERIVVVGHVSGAVTSSRFSRASVSKFTFVSKKGNIFYVEAWNRPYLSKILNNDDIYTLIGSYDLKNNKVNLINLTKGEAHKGEFIKPIYSKLFKDFREGKK